MKKKLLTMLAAMLLAGTNAFAEAVEIDGIWYNLVSKATVAEVTSTPDNYNIYIGAVNIPEKVTYNGVDYDVTSIGGAAFQNSNVTSITIPNSVTSIGEYAFSDCIKLTSIDIPNNVTTIEFFTFYNCINLVSVTIPNSVTNIKSGAFLNCWSLSSIDIPNSVTKIWNQVFQSCTNLTSFTISNNVTSIEQQTFHNCSRLTSITIPNSVTDISYSAFSYCSSLASIIIPNSVRSIRDNAFQDCSSLTSITIGNGIESIKSKAFANCPNLTDVYCYAENVPSTYANTFEGSYIDYATLHVPVASVGADGQNPKYFYKGRSPWSTFGTIAPIYDEESSKPFPAGTYAKADLKRTFAEGWNTICLPFAIDNIEAAFGTGAKAYGFDDFADGELKFSQVTSLAAGTPYVIYVPAEITELIAFENIVVEESNTTSSNIDKNGAYFRGTYAPVAAGKWTKNNSTDNIYGLTPDGRIRKAGPEASILGLRGYFDIPAGTEVKGFVFEDGATAITEITENTENSEPIYNLAGQRLNKAQKGINIVNGRKKVLY